MKKTMLAMLMLSIYAHAETSTWTDDSGDWYHSEGFATRQAEVRAGNRASKLCRKSGGMVVYKTWEYSDGTCETKEVSAGKSIWKCTATATTQCATKGETVLRCASGTRKIFQIEGVSGPKHNVLKIKDTKSGMLYTINTLHSSDTKVHNILCGEPVGDDRSVERKLLSKLKSYQRKWCREHPNECISKSAGNGIRN